MKTRIGTGLMVIAAYLATLACATILNDKNPPLTVTLNPAGVEVHVDLELASEPSE